MNKRINKNVLGYKKQRKNRKKLYISHLVLLLRAYVMDMSADAMSILPYTTDFTSLYISVQCFVKILQPFIVA